MNEKIYTEFIEQELNDKIRDMLIEAIEDKNTHTNNMAMHSFNRFNVIVDRVNSKITIEDVIFYDSEGDDYVMPIDSFLSMLKSEKDKA